MKSSIIDECFRIAFKENESKRHPEYKNYSHWTFVIQGNKLLGYGKNRPGKPFYSNFGYSTLAKIHSEHDAYRKVKGILDDRKDFEVFNIRLNRQNEIRITKPCACCTRFLQFIGCSTVWFTSELGVVKLILGGAE